MRRINMAASVTRPSRLTLLRGRPRREVHFGSLTHAVLIVVDDRLIVNESCREGVNSQSQVVVSRCGGSRAIKNVACSQSASGKFLLQFFGFTSSLPLHLSTLEQCRLCFGCRRLAPLGTDITIFLLNLPELEHATTCTLRNLIPHRTIGQ